MKILFVNNFRGRGGGEEFLRDLLPGLARQGVQVGLVCRPGTPLEQMFRGSAVAVYPIDRSGTGALTSAFRIARIIRDEGYRVVNIQRGHDIIQAWVASLLSITRPVLLFTPQVPEFKHVLFLLGRMDGIVTISRHIKGIIAREKPSLASKVTIIHYGIDLDRFRPGAVPRGSLRKRLGLSPEVRILGTVGDLWKNQIDFLDALAGIRAVFPDARYALVAAETGIGQIETFKRRAAELGLTDAVVWTGRLSKDEMLTFYADIDIAVSTHRNEGFGIWILEALAMGRPAVAFNAGGVRDSLEGCPAGALVDGGPKELAAEIVRILTNDGVRQRMEAAGPAWVKARFSRERMVEEYYRFFETVIKGKG